MIKKNRKYFSIFSLLLIGLILIVISIVISFKLTRKQTNLQSRANMESTQESPSQLFPSSQVGCKSEGMLIPPGGCIAREDNQIRVCRINTANNTITYGIYTDATDISCNSKINCTATDYRHTEGFPCCYGISIGGKCQSQCTLTKGESGNGYIELKKLENPIKSGTCQSTSNNEGLYCHGLLADKFPLADCQEREAKAAQIQKLFTTSSPEEFFCEDEGCQPMSSYIFDDAADVMDYTPNYALCDEANKKIIVSYALSQNQCAVSYSSFYFEPRIPPPLPRETDFMECNSNYDTRRALPPGYCSHLEFCHAGRTRSRTLGKVGNYESNPLNPCPAKKENCIADQYPISEQYPCCSGQSYSKDSLRLCGNQPTPTPMSRV